MDNYIHRFNTSVIVPVVKVLDEKPLPSDSPGILSPVSVSIILPNEYIHCELIVKDDFARSIEAVLVMYNPVDRFNTNGIVLAVKALDKKSSPSDLPSTL